MCRREPHLPQNSGESISRIPPPCSRTHLSYADVAAVVDGVFDQGAPVPSATMAHQAARRLHQLQQLHATRATTTTITTTRPC
jgi:hypothetical protein